MTDMTKMENQEILIQEEYVKINDSTTIKELSVLMLLGAAVITVNGISHLIKRNQKKKERARNLNRQTREEIIWRMRKERCSKEQISDAEKILDQCL